MSDCVITLHNGVEVRLDAEDYQWAIKWRWHAKPDKHRRKFYACRTQSQRHGPDEPRSHICLYLHVEIQKRTGKPAPTLNHNMVDHLDGDSTNCQRDNLRWATAGMNARNRYGKAVRQGELNA